MRFLIVLVLAIFPMIAEAGGLNRVGGVGPAIGTSGAYVATADPFGGHYYNPAAWAGAQSKALMVGWERVDARFHYRGQKGNRRSGGEPYDLPFVSGVLPLTDRLVLAGGICVPYGLGAEFDRNPEQWFMNTRSELSLVNASIGFGWQASQRLALGLTVHVGQAELVYEAPLELAGIRWPLKAESGAIGFGLGWQVGLQYQMSSQWRLGLSYTSTQTANLSGRTNLPLGISDRFDSQYTFPDRLQVGLEYRISPRIILLADWAHYGYSGRNRELRLDFNRLPAIGLPLGWKDNRTYHLGMKAELNDNWRMSLGWNYMTQAVPDNRVSTLIPDMSGWNLAFQLTKIGSKLERSIFVAYGQGSVRAGHPRVKFSSEILTVGMSFSF
ncbi:MAG: OmpP1/FadL family transporter [Patescibacteria group bacterium]